MLTKLPNILTVSRIVAIPVILGIMFIPPPLGNWLALAVYTYAAVTDILDGYLARIWSQQSNFGRFLDPIADKLLIAALLLMLVGIDRIGGITILPAAVILCREILVSGLREFLAEVRVGLPVSSMSKIKTFIQILALGFLIVGDAGPDFWGVPTLDIGIYGLWAAAVITLITGYDYLVAGLGHIARSDAEGAGK
ncbi:MAG: CDP-diacylglycerol--glycerol-3-phosphate 3-phosphatidyltransferase [Rhodospirillales bacterium RIFCSPLOWO2_12_FULL_58_28]|nr:MAG: CDP-diacylglycerol--glycerol-3-phosphate 3-phosphatidyltransferase [Rhodospirillales bacterium RIFCSPLOWO2_02_FULL_58_16]OHC79257.1 MAG: CDP-diacylglycerol--glycerol-3-phosphate 3-phosphatidyltransferase [Rhodospirillales bacterium RIFCSPLOWO2_12_FULL_58_28]